MYDKKKENLYEKLSIFVEELIKAEPPFDEIHQLEGMDTPCKNYIKYYRKLEDEARKKIIAAQLSLVKHFVKGSVYGFRNLPEQNLDLVDVLRDFHKWCRDRDVYIPKSKCSNYEKLNVKGLLKKEIPNRYPGLKFKKFSKHQELISFMELLYDDTNIVISFDKGSYGEYLSLLIGSTNPNIFGMIGKFFGFGSFAVYFNNLKEFYEGLEETYQVLDFFVPKFKKALMDAHQE